MITKYLIKTLKNNGIFEEKNEAVVRYGLTGLLSTLFSFITIIFIGICCNCLFESILFTISFYFLRIYAGGYHADTPIKCYGISLIISTTIFALIHNINVSIITLHIIFVITSINILYIAPIDTTNKPLSLKEKKFYKKKTQHIIFIHSIVYLVSGITNNYNICWSIGMSLGVTLFLLTISKKKHIIS